MATPIPGAQVLDNGPGSASTTTPTSAATAPGPRLPPLPDRPAPVANMTPNMSTMVFDGPGSAGKAVKRPRPVKSCNSCRQRKLRCDRTCPCSQCNKSNRLCKYANEHEPGPLSEGSDVEASPRPTKRPHRPAPPYVDVPPPQPHSTPGSVGVGGGGSVHEPSRGVPGSVLDYFGARLERLEKFVFNPSPAPMGAAPEWGPSRTPYAPYATVTGSPTTIRSLSVKGNLRTRFFGQNETRVLLNLFDEAREFILNRSRGDDIRVLFEQLHKIYMALQEENRRALAPISVFTDSMISVQKRMADILPSKPICDRLLEAYIAMSEGLYRVIHVPSFKAEYETFWAQAGVSDAFLPRLMCMLSLGARFETETRGLSHDRADGIHAPTACALARGWLDGLRGKQLVDIDTLQCEVLHLHASRMMSSRNQESWTQLGFIVRMAMTMGLHRDPDEFPQIRPFYAELRRRLWYTVIDMDLHVALACNLPCAVREGEYTCRPPSNLDDNDIFPDMNKLPVSKPIDEYTNSQLQAYASRTLPHRIRVSSIINRLDTIRDFQEVLDCGIKLEQLLDDVNHLFPRRNQTLDPRAKFKEWRMRALLDMHVRRPLLALYRPFALSTVECPSHITTSYLKSSMVMLTYMDELDPSMPGFSDVSHMYHVVLKHDIMQAAFSVCYFIRSANEQLARNNMAALNGQLPSPDAIQHDGVGFINALDNRMVWSTQGMTRAVQQTLDSFVAMVKDSSCDLKDTLILSAVLNSVKGATHEERVQRITEGIVKIVDASMVSLNTSPEAIANMPMMSGPNTPVDPYAPQGMYSPNTFFDDFSCWDTDQWDLSTNPVGLI
ncbi:hypothetical protein VMCG_08930 [Cytospora schulzeri]|uniref:Zn(2)-C6 fungal-type domain-containing protein n=1 Tax=Cytospora schulzeri TaxID=448051 RepID=A0A423VNQ3_9PEZI|nr:hypothetical protein VMCG_08930 [Valsa malicola]